MTCAITEKKCTLTATRQQVRRQHHLLYLHRHPTRSGHCHRYRINRCCDLQLLRHRNNNLLSQRNPTDSRRHLPGNRQRGCRSKLQCCHLSRLCIHHQQSHSHHHSRQPIRCLWYCSIRCYLCRNLYTERFREL